MRSNVCLVLFAGILIGTALPALAFPRLPLQEGEFTRGECRSKPGDSMRHSDPTESIGIYTVLDVPKPYQFISPVAEDQYGYCKIGQFKTLHKSVAGRARCTEGKMESFSGNYTFDYQIVNSYTFASKGIVYKWCSPHR